MLSTVEKVLFLKSIDLFSQIPGEDLAQIALISTEETRDTNDEIFAEGESGDALYLVLDGKVRVHREDRVIAELGERECFGEMVPVKNRDLWEPLLDVALHSPPQVTFRWVKGHSGDHWNDRVDELATQAADSGVGTHGSVNPGARLR